MTPRRSSKSAADTNVSIFVPVCGNDFLGVTTFVGATISAALSVAGGSGTVVVGADDGPDTTATAVHCA